MSPSFMNMILSALRMVKSLWAITNVVLPSIMDSMACVTMASVLVSMFDVASSRMRILGSARTALASTRSCFSPTDSWEFSSLMYVS